MVNVSKTGITARKYPKCYFAWSNMIDRCYNENSQYYSNYGGRGIKVCQEWLDSFQTFFYDMGEPEDKSLSLDRINSNGNYTRDNCRWATRFIQGYNQRKSTRNQSGKTGVSFRKDTNNWRVRINFEGTHICVGSYKTYEEAVKAREEAELKYYGYIKE